MIVNEGSFTSGIFIYILSVCVASRFRGVKTYISSYTYIIIIFFLVMKELPDIYISLVHKPRGYIIFVWSDIGQVCM